MEHIIELANGKCIRKYSPEHVLFDAGTRMWATKYCNNAESEQVSEGAPPKSVTCHLAKCNVEFQSLAAYEEHYDVMHRNVCRECSRSFLSMRLLDIHISERHDAFFKILSKKKPMYVCLVDGCPNIFKHEDKRTRHLIQLHQYPESYPFQQQKQERKTKEVAGKNNDTKQLEISVDVETAKRREARKRRRQQKKKKLLEQTKYRDDEMQVDVTSNPRDIPVENASEVVDIDMDELEKTMRKLHIPKSIHFGRKRRI